MRGTPTTVLIDANGNLRHQLFGVHDDLLLGAQLQSLILEATAITTKLQESHHSHTEKCDDDGCGLPTNKATIAGADR